MKVVFFSTSEAEWPVLEAAAPDNIHVTLTELALSTETVLMARSFDAISIGAADDASGEMIDKLYEAGIRYMALRTDRSETIDIPRAEQLGMIVTNVPLGPSIAENDAGPESTKYRVDITFYNLECYRKDLRSGNELTSTEHLGQATVYFR